MLKLDCEELMPANLPPEYFEVEKKLREAKNTNEKIEIYEELLSVIPKHKGTEKLIGDIKSKIAKLKLELEKKPVSKHAPKYFIKRQGAGQIALIGPPNSGKSSLISVLTNAKPEITDYPFSTKEPVAGMMPFENIQIQLIDTPSISDVFMESYIHEIVKKTDLTVVVIDLQSPLVLEELDSLLQKLQEKRVYLKSPISEEFPEQNFHICKAIIGGNKNENSEAEDNLNILKDLYGKRFEFVPISVKETRNLEFLKKRLFELLEIIRVYTKEPGKKPDLSSPFTVKRGSTLEDLALMIHKEFASRLNFARVWGKGKFEGQKVHRFYVLEDEDIVEFHIR